MLLHVCNVFVMGVLLSLLSCRFISCVESDINCLKSIKAELEDPLNMLGSTWNFNNATEGFLCNFLGVECWHPHERRVLKIKLGDLGLKGQFPRGVANCTSLVVLDLSNNRLSGTIPDDIGDLLAYITSLDVSFNSFSGEIPSSISNCIYLNVLKLDNNNLTGKIPQEIGHMCRLRTFSVANNQLSGPVDANNVGLCRAPLPSSAKKKWTKDLVRAIKTHAVLMFGSLGFGIGFVFSFFFFVSR